jgi:hypothetical protein
MPEPVIAELKKLSDIAVDMDLASNLRKDALKSVGQIWHPRSPAHPAGAGG